MLIERRSVQLTEVRVDNPDKPVITGHAAVFNQLSGNLGGFREKIRSGAFTNAIKSDDVRALWNHDHNFVLGRTKSKTLELSEDQKGLRITIYPPDTIFANDFLQSIARGDVDEMSFGFTARGKEQEDWRVENGEVIRELINVKLFDVSPATFPAYPTTDLQARSYFDAKIKELAAPSIDPKEFERVKAFLDSRTRPLSLAEIIKRARVIAP